MNRETFIIGDKSYSASKIGAFASNDIILKLQKIVLPAIGQLKTDNSKATDVMDMDIGKLLQFLSTQLNQSVMTDIVMPMFKLSQVACTTDNIKIDSAAAIDKVFSDADGLADFYVLVFEVLKYNFAGFFTKLTANFGNKDGDLKVKD